MFSFPFPWSHGFTAIQTVLYGESKFYSQSLLFLTLFLQSKAPNRPANICFKLSKWGKKLPILIQGIKKMVLSQSIICLFPSFKRLSRSLLSLKIFRRSVPRIIIPRHAGEHTRCLSAPACALHADRYDTHMQASNRANLLSMCISYHTAFTISAYSISYDPRSFMCWDILVKQQNAREKCISTT